MTYSKTVYAVDRRFEYDILRDGDLCVHQDYHPDEAGFVAMDEATANACADVVIARMSASDSAGA